MSEGLTILYKYIPEYNYVISESEAFGTLENPLPDFTRINNDTVEIPLLYGEITASNGQDLYMIYTTVDSNIQTLIIKKYSK